MGARSSSPRTVQLDNDSPTNVIEVSDAVVDRLKGLHVRGIRIKNFSGKNNNLKVVL